MGAGFVALAATAAIAAAPGTALAQDTTLNEDNAWAVDQIQAPAAWETTQGEGITVAVMDTGITDHPFFADKDVLPGYTIFSDEEDAWNDTDGHGSAVAAGVLLAAPEATLLPVRLDSGADTGIGGAMGETEYEAFRWAADNGADVLVVPWHLLGTVFDEDLEVLQYVIDKGAIIVASAGNEPGDEVGFPASTPGVVAVTGTDSSGNIWSESTTTGPEVVLAAPADEMTVPLPQVGSLGDSGELYGQVFGGTSMGSGYVGGVAALTWAAHPDIDSSNVIQRLIQTAGDGSGTRSEDAGYGLVNADQAVNAEGIEAVEENPLGYPMGEAGASGATPDDDASSAAPESGAESAGPSAAAGANKESNLSAIIVIAAAVVLLAAAIVVWLVLRGRGRKAAAAGQSGPIGPGNGPDQTGYQPAVPVSPQFGAPPSGGQNYGGPPPPQGFSSPPSGQGFNPPGSAGEPSPWRPSDPNRR